MYKNQLCNIGTTEYDYLFNYANNTASFSFDGVRCGTIFVPYLNAKQLHTEHAIELLRIIEKAYIRYWNKITTKNV